MTWPADPNRCPDDLTRLREQLAAVDEFIRWEGAPDQIHYPICNVSGERGTPDPLPAILVSRRTTKRLGYASDVPGVLQGEYELIFYFSTDTHPLAADCEKTVGDIIHDLTFQAIGHLWGDPDIGEASEPTAAARAATQGGKVNNYRSVTVTLPWGAQP